MVNRRDSSSSSEGTLEMDQNDADVVAPNFESIQSGLEAMQTKLESLTDKLEEYGLDADNSVIGDLVSAMQLLKNSIVNLQNVQIDFINKVCTILDLLYNQADVLCQNQLPVEQ